MHTLKLYYGSRLYTNRIVDEPLPDPKYTFDNINFILNDGITTVQTVNKVDSEESPSYLTATDETGKTTNWYVIGSQKNRKNQLTLSLRRDFLSEYWDQLKDQPFICTKSSTIPDDLSYAKYGKSMSLSQIPDKLYLLKDRSLGEGWIVFYVDKSLFEGSTAYKGTTITYKGKTLQFQPTITQGDRNCTDAMYDIFGIPLGGSIFWANSHNPQSPTYESHTYQNYTRDSDELFALISQIAIDLGGFLYDVQLLPYFPGQHHEQVEIYQDETPNSSIDEITTYETGQKHVNIVTFAIWATTDSDKFTVNIPHEIFPDSTKGLLEQRKWGEKNYFRLCSPDFSNQFEFMPSRMSQDIPYFNVAITLRPNAPFLYVAMPPSGLYGTGTQLYDGAGLVCTTNFSITRVNDAWVNYQLNNKNYQQIFNRQIQSMDLSNRIADEDAKWNIAMSGLNILTNTVGGTMQGMTTGAIVGGTTAGPAGAFVGGMVGGIGNTITGIADFANTIRQENNAKALRNDTLDRTKDMFQYQNGNIQAMPSTLTNLDAINPTFRLYPVIEWFICTTTEANNLENSIKYNGIDINLMTKLSSFSSGYIQGSILHFPETLHINDTQATAINSELQYGIYYKEV